MEHDKLLIYRFLSCTGLEFAATPKVSVEHALDLKARTHTKVDDIRGMPMNRQLRESAKLGGPLVAPANGLDEIVIPITTARAVIERDRAGRQQAPNATRNQQAALEAIPHVIDALTALWGYHECSNYLRRLLVIDTERDNRQGFSREAFDELVFLYRLIQDSRGALIAEIMPKIQLDELKHRERLLRIEAAYLRRS